ncbi:MAG: hypothetical protein JW774_00515, partial [Candidatus Aureabacteria bacterium]|nr:hypothetical protein [Candidatus Auribacterota bacterium]
RKVMEYLMKHHSLEKPFHAVLDGRQNVRILTDGVKNFYLCYNDKEVVEHLKGGGQYLLLDVSDVAMDLKDKLKALHLYKRKKSESKLRKILSA